MASELEYKVRGTKYDEMIREYVAEDLEIPNAGVNENATSVSVKAEMPTSTPSGAWKSSPVGGHG